MSARDGDCQDGCQEHRTCREPAVLELHNGRWRPSVPLPWFGLLHVRCGCGRRFWGRVRGIDGRPRDRYEDHYRVAHIGEDHEQVSGG